MSAQDRSKMIEGQLTACELFVKAKREMGINVERAEHWHELAKEQMGKGEQDAALKSICEARAVLQWVGMRWDFPYVEPSSLGRIKACLPKDQTRSSDSWKYDLASERYYDQVYGGWLGKNIGGALGAPVEGWTKDKIFEKYGEVWDYLEPPSSLNDDTAYQIIALHAFQEFGLDLNSEILAKEWVEHLPKAFTAERVALDNLVKGIMPPDSGIVDNPYSEWIGAQMKGEIWGFIAPSNPELAMKYAYLDGIIAHEKNGVYGEIYDSVLVSLAFVESDLPKLLLAALSYVPEKSRLAELVKTTMAWCDEYPTWQEAWAKVEESYARTYHPVHTFPNLCAVIIGLLYGDGDFERSLCITNMCGLDTDCTAGQAGGIMGVIKGADGIPAKWKDPIGDVFESFVIGFEKLKTSEVARQTCEIGRQLAART